MKCECPKPEGICPVFNRTASPLLHLICRTDTPEAEQRRQKWLTEKDHVDPAFQNKDFKAEQITLEDLKKSTPKPEKRKPCKFLGKDTGERVDCVTCKGKTSLFVMACEVFKTCTVGKKVDGHACCVGCQKYQLLETPK